MMLDMSCVLLTDATRTDMTDGQMVGYISKMSVKNIYYINKKVEVSCCKLVSLGTDLLAKSGCLKGLK